MQVFDQPSLGLQHFGGGQVFARGQEVVDLAEDPGAALRGAADHHGVGFCVGQHIACFLRTVNVAIGHHRNAQSGFHGSDGVVLGKTFVALFPGAPMHGDQGDASVFCCTGQTQSITFCITPARAHLQGDGHVVRRTRSDHGFNDLKRQRLVLHQGRTCPFIANLFGWAAHVDVNDLCASINVVSGRLGHHGGLGAGNLH